MRVGEIGMTHGVTVHGRVVGARNVDWRLHVGSQNAPQRCADCDLCRAGNGLDGSQDVVAGSFETETGGRGHVERTRNGGRPIIADLRNYNAHHANDDKPA